MATKVAYTLREDKQELQKQFGCMNGIFQLFDRRYLLGQYRHGRNHKQLTPGQGEHVEKERKNSSEKAKEKNAKKAVIEKSRASVESSRNSFSSSCSSTTVSSFDCSKRIQTECQVASEPTSPNLRKKQPDWSLQLSDIRGVVKDSMTREMRVKTGERGGIVMKHVDSPRPFVQYYRKDRNLSKVEKTSKEVAKEITRFSCDEKESKYSLKSTFKVKELPRLSLDSKQNSNRSSLNESKRSLPMRKMTETAPEQSHEPGSNKRPSSGVVARLMGLDSFMDSVCEVEISKIEVERTPLKNKEDLLRSKSAKSSVYGEMEKRLSVLDFKAPGKDLRALKQVLEAMQATTKGFENKQQSLNAQKTVSPTVKGTSSPLNRAVKPAKMATNPMINTGPHSVNHATRKQETDRRNKNRTRSLSPSRTREDVNGERPISSPRLQRSKSGVDQKCPHGSLSESSIIKRKSLVQPIVLGLKNRKPRTKTVEARNLSQEPETNPSLEITVNDQPKENHSISEGNIGDPSIEDKPTVELTKLTIEQPSPVSVLDAIYIEDTPSPVKKKPNAFNDYENLYFDETEWNQVGIDNFVNCIDKDHYSNFNNVKLENRNHLVYQPELLNSTNGDHQYISEILLASGFLKDLDSAIRLVQLQPTGSLIKPELFHFLEKTEAYTEKECHGKNSRLKSKAEMRRKLIFDCVNDTLIQKLADLGSYGRLVNGEKLLKELCLEVQNLETRSNKWVGDEDDEVKILVSSDVNKKSENWSDFCCEVPGLVLDIERSIFKDLINEIVNLQDRPGRHCRQLFPL